MNSASQPFVPVTNPLAVVKIIDSPNVDLAGSALDPAIFADHNEALKNADQTQANLPASEAGDNDDDANQPLLATDHDEPVSLRLHVNTEDSIETNAFQLEQAPTPQVQQLVDYLHEKQKELTQREADLQAKQFDWDKEVLTINAQFRKQESELQQHLSQVKRQQEQLVLLQQSLVDSQSNIRAAVEQMLEACDAGELKERLERLKLKLNECFHDNFQNWEALVDVIRR